MIKWSCPICEKNFYDKVYWAHIPSTPWTNECCCCDMNDCVAHQFDDDERPARPSEETMTKRAEYKALKQEETFNKEIETYKQRYEELKKEYYLKGYEDALKGDEPEYELEF